MKIDTYTRFLLTVITLCLFYLCAKDVIPTRKVHADTPMAVVLVDAQGNPIVGHANTGRYLFVMTPPQ